MKKKLFVEGSNHGYVTALLSREKDDGPLLSKKLLLLFLVTLKKNRRKSRST